MRLWPILYKVMQGRSGPVKSPAQTSLDAFHRVNRTAPSQQLPFITFPLANVHFRR